MANATLDARQDAGTYRRVESITGRRRWTAEEKARIVAESVQEGASRGRAATRSGVWASNLSIGITGQRRDAGGAGGDVARHA
jgi:transposase